MGDTFESVLAELHAAVLAVGGTLHPWAHGVWFDASGTKRYGMPDDDHAATADWPDQANAPLLSNNTTEWLGDPAPSDRPPCPVCAHCVICKAACEPTHNARSPE